MRPRLHSPTHMVSPALRLLALGLLTLLAACSRCGSGRPGAREESLARLVPRTADAVVLVPDLGRLGARLAELQRLEAVDFVAPLAGARDGKALVDALVRQAGLDPRSRAGLERAGLDPARGMALVLLPGDAVYSVLAVKDARALEETAARLARQLSGAGVASRAEERGVTVTRYATAEGAPPRLALAVQGGWAFLGAGPAAARVAELVALTPEQSLEGEPVFTAGRARLQGEHELLAFVPGGSRYLPQGSVPGVTLTASLGLTGITVRADAPWGDEPEVLQALTPQPGAPELSGYLPADAVAVARHAGDPAQLGQYWPYLVGPQVTRAVQAAGFDLEAEVLRNLRPGAVASLSLAPTVRMSGMPALSMRRTNPFLSTHLVLVAGARDAAQVAATLEKVPPVARRFGAELTPEQRGGQRVLLTRYMAGEGAHLAGVGDRVLVAAPESRLVEGLARLRAAAGPAPLSTQRMAALEGKGLAVVVDLHKLADAVRALPAEAWGIGGFALKPTTVRWLDALHELTAVEASLTAKERAVQAELRLRLEARKR